MTTEQIGKVYMIDYLGNKNEVDWNVELNEGDFFSFDTLKDANNWKNDRTKETEVIISNIRHSQILNQYFVTIN